ncbi:hypothetical protein D3C72_1937940 [compost metagenome]
MAVGKADQDRVVADRLDRVDADLALAGLQHFLPRAVALDFSGRRIHAQQLERQPEAAAVVEADLQHAGLRVDRQRGGMGSVFVQACHDDRGPCYGRPR